MRTDLLCNIEASLLEVLQIFNTNAKGIAFVIDDEEKLQGVVSDGDVRRWLIDGIELNAKVKDLMSSEYTFAHNMEDPAKILNMTNERVRHIPIVDDDHKVVDFVQYDSRFKLPVASPNLEGNEFNYLVEAFLSTWISSTGAYINQFEEKFAAYCGQKHGVATSNGTVALHLALTALGIKEGDEVIIPDLTFAATINAVLYCNATPVIVDVEEESWCIDPEEIKKAITPKTKAIIPVHLYGQPCDMDPIMELARANNLYVVEDCAEAHGALYKGKVVGSFGDINCFSFYANKIITTGEGGMCITNDAELDRKMRVYRDHGMSKEKKYWHEVVGFNYRMTNLQASIGVGQLERIDDIINFRKSIESDYINELEGLNHVKFQGQPLDNKKVTWLVCATIENGRRDEYMDALNGDGIDCRPFFYPLSEMPIYAKYCYSNQVSTLISRKGVNFPTSQKVSADTLRLIRSTLEK